MGTSPFFGSAMNLGGISIPLIPLALWSACWTGIALWHAARRGEKWWFLLFLLVHTAGILEGIYLVFVAKVLKTKKRTVRKSP
jgi:hypothetical protein